MGAPRKNKLCNIKTFRFDPEFVEDMERVIFFVTKEVEGGMVNKYSSMTDFLVKAGTRLIEEERRVLEEEGVAWEHLKPGFKQRQTEEVRNG